MAAASRPPRRATPATSPRNLTHVLIRWESIPAAEAGSCRLGLVLSTCGRGRNNHYGALGCEQRACCEGRFKSAPKLSFIAHHKMQR